MQAHSAGAAELLGDRELVDAVCSDYTTAPLAAPEKALFAFLAKVNDRCHEVAERDIDALHSEGWTDEAIYDAFTVCSLFNFYNRWVDAFGGQPISAAEQRLTGRRLAARGYIVRQE